MKRIIILLAVACATTGTLSAQTDKEIWKTQVEGLPALISSQPEQASETVDQLLKGKNKKNVELLIAIGRAYLEAGKNDEADVYRKKAQDVDNKNANVYVLEGDIALAKEEVGTAGRAYEQAIYFDPQCVKAYLQFAKVYKKSNPQLAIDKLKELKSVNPGDLSVDRELADVYYLNNRLKEAVEEYADFIDTPIATETDMVKYAFALFQTHDFAKSLEVTNKGLQKNPNNTTLNRLAMYNHTDLKQFDQAEAAAEKFFNASSETDFSSLDYRYYGHLLMQQEKTEEAVTQFHKALEKEPTNVALWNEISKAYENDGTYDKAVEAYLKYYTQLLEKEQTPDVIFQLGRLYYAEGTSSDTLVIGPEVRHEALERADSVFTIVAEKAPNSHIGGLWRARTNSALDPETTEGLAKPYYEAVIELLLAKNDPRYNSVIIECYSYLGYYYLVAEDYETSKEYWNKILAIDPSHAVANKALEGLK